MKRLKRWTKQSTPKPTGRLNSEEFEHEILAEERVIYRNQRVVRECTARVFDREYWHMNESAFVKK